MFVLSSSEPLPSLFKLPPGGQKMALPPDFLFLIRHIKIPCKVLMKLLIYQSSLLDFGGRYAFLYLYKRVAQSVTCLATDACLTADPGVASSIPVRSHTFVEIDHEMISTVILLPSADSFKKGCCQLQAKVCA